MPEGSPDKKAVKKPLFGFKPPTGKKPTVTPVKDHDNQFESQDLD